MSLSQVGSMADDRATANFDFNSNFDIKQYTGSYLTTALGEHIAKNTLSLTVGEHGPIVLSDRLLVEKLQSIANERIPERVVHAKGSAAHGIFEVTNDMSAYTKADLFNGVGKKTPVFSRFSTTNHETGSSDTIRDTKGLGLKFYTTQGNYDLTMIDNTVFPIRDPMKFADLVHAQRREPGSGLLNYDNKWDFFS